MIVAGARVRSGPMLSMYVFLFSTCRGILKITEIELIVNPTGPFNMEHNKRKSNM